MSDYFLVKTADQRFWKKDENLLFLGEWCKDYNQKHTWSKLQSKTLPYHWDDRDKMYQDWQYLQDTYEKTLVQLAESLNKVHGVTRSLRYWRIIVGPWLYCFIEILYDRYLSISKAIEFCQIKNTWIPDIDKGKCVPKDFQTFTTWNINDEYNLYIYSRIIEILKAFPFEKKNFALNFKPLSQGGNDSKRYTLLGLGRVGLKFLWKFIPDYFNRIVFASSYFNSIDLMRLQLSLGQLPYFSNPSIDIPEARADWELRKQLKVTGTGKAFEDLLDDLLPEQIPKAFLEHYSEIKIFASRNYQNFSKLILTGNAHYTNEGFKIWTAEQIEQGVKLAGIQHGGNYGISRLLSNENHEIEISDQYLSWGWRSKKHTKVVPLSASKLVGIKNKISPDPCGNILWACVFLPRYFYRMYSVPVGPQVEKYIQDQKQFFHSSSEEAKKLLIMRVKPYEFGWQIKDRLHDWGSDIPLDLGLMIQSMQEGYLGGLLMSMRSVMTRLCLVASTGLKELLRMLGVKITSVHQIDIRLPLVFDS